MTDWVNVSENLPEDGRWYLVAAITETPCGGEKVTTMAFLDFDTVNGLPLWLAHNDKESDEWHGVTHWMPLPQPPKG